MYVPSPYMSSVGVAYWRTLAKASRTPLAPFKDTPAAAIESLPDHVVTYPSYSSKRERRDMSSGIVNDRYFTDTTYFNMSTRYIDLAEARSISFQGAYYNNGDGTGSRYHRVYRANSEGTGFGYTGGFGTGKGDPAQVFDFRSTSGFSVHTLNTLAMRNLRNRLENEAKIKAKDIQLDLAESLVDAAATVELVATRVAQVLRALNQVRKGQFRQAARTLGLNRVPRDPKGSAASIWLEYSYGWMPLLNDIHTGVEMANNALLRDDAVATVTRRGQISLLAPNTDQRRVIDYSSSANGFGEVKYRFRIADEWLDFFGRVALDNPLYIAWVSMPLSFVVDWLAPVGDWLKGFGDPVGLQFVGGYGSFRADAMSKTKFALFKNDTPPATMDPRATGSYNIEYGQWSMETCVLQRVKYTTWPQAMPYFRFPFSSVSRLLSTAALLEATIGQRGRR